MRGSQLPRGPAAATPFSTVVRVHLVQAQIRASDLVSTKINPVCMHGSHAACRESRQLGNLLQNHTKAPKKNTSVAGAYVLTIPIGFLGKHGYSKLGLKHFCKLLVLQLQSQPLREEFTHLPPFIQLSVSISSSWHTDQRGLTQHAGRHSLP